MLFFNVNIIVGDKKCLRVYKSKIVEIKINHPYLKVV